LPSAEQFAAQPLKGTKIGWLGNYSGYLEMEPGVLGLCEQSLKTVVGAGAIVEECTPDYDMARLWQTWLTLRHWSANWAKFLYDDPAMRSQLKPELIWEIEGSFGLTGQDLFVAGRARSDWSRALGRLFDRFDFLAVPTAQVFPFNKNVHWPTTINDRQMDTYHRWMEVVIGGTLGGIPVVNVPVGFDPSGRPMGMQIMGRFGDDQRVLEFAMAYEKVTPFLEQRPDLQKSSP
jgi:amidase